MRRRSPVEKIEPYRRRLHRHAGESLRDELSGWAATAQHDGHTFPEMPKGVEDRDADVWEPLLALAEAAGGTWPERATAAAKALVAERKSNGSDLSLGVRLLADIKTVFTQMAIDRIATEKLIDSLRALEEGPWDDLRGKALDPRGLAARLRRYDIHPKQIRIGVAKTRGYEGSDFRDAWLRPSRLPPPRQAVHPVQTVRPTVATYRMYRMNRISGRGKGSATSAETHSTMSSAKAST